MDNEVASFDRLRMRAVLRAPKIAPHPEPVEGHAVDMQSLMGPE